MRTSNCGAAYEQAAGGALRERVVAHRENGRRRPMRIGGGTHEIESRQLMRIGGGGDENTHVNILITAATCSH